MLRLRPCVLCKLCGWTLRRAWVPQRSSSRARGSMPSTMSAPALSTNMITRRNGDAGTPVDPCVQRQSKRASLVPYNCQVSGWGGRSCACVNINARALGGA